MVLIGILAAIAVPTYLSQQNEAKDTAAQAQLRIAATAQQLYYVKEDEYANSADDLEDYGFRQGGQTVEVKTTSATDHLRYRLLHASTRGQRSVQDLREHG